MNCKIRWKVIKFIVNSNVKIDKVVKKNRQRQGSLRGLYIALVSHVAPIPFENKYNVAQPG